MVLPVVVASGKFQVVIANGSVPSAGSDVATTATTNTRPTRLRPMMQSVGKIIN